MADASQAFLATEASAYSANDRAELVARLPRPLGRVLDVELNPTAAEAARELFDEVLGRAREFIALQWAVLARR